ncbi:MAG: UvrD-helicase domain-containing protein, partial [Ruminococcus sp.]|nr:UvrD-helicase domain-containing protein [Ruminococcus sp.]
MNWTKQQQEAIDARNCSVIVSAAAGSGKTAVLTERLSQLLADESPGVRADRIAIVTFTRAAAAEMKKRLDVKLRDRIALDPSDQHLLRQQTLLQSARICTINAFCFDLLRDNITDQGITASFTPLDGTDDLTLRQQAMDELLQWYNDNRYEDISRLYDKLCINGESSLTGAIRLMDSFLSSEAVRSMWLDKAAQEYQKPFEKSVYFTDLLSVCRRKLNSLLAKIDDYTAVIPLIFEEGTNEPVCGKFLESAAKEYEAVSDISAALARGELPGEDILSREIFGRLPAIKKTVNFSEAYKNLFTKKRDGVKKEVRELVSLISSAGENFTETADVALLLIDAVRRYQDILWQHKCERNAISFDDGERLVLDLLISFD